MQVLPLSHRDKKTVFERPHLKKYQEKTSAHHKTREGSTPKVLLEVV